MARNDIDIVYLRLSNEYFRESKIVIPKDAVVQIRFGVRREDGANVVILKDVNTKKVSVYPTTDRLNLLMQSMWEAPWSYYTLEAHNMNSEFSREMESTEVDFYLTNNPYSIEEEK